MSNVPVISPMVRAIPPPPVATPVPLLPSWWLRKWEIYILIATSGCIVGWLLGVVILTHHNKSSEVVPKITEQQYYRSQINDHDLYPRNGMVVDINPLATPIRPIIDGLAGAIPVNTFTMTTPQDIRPLRTGTNGIVVDNTNRIIHVQDISMSSHFPSFVSINVWRELLEKAEEYKREIDELKKGLLELSNHAKSNHSCLKN